jgi:hypothetical protein
VNHLVQGRQVCLVEVSTSLILEYLLKPIVRPTTALPIVFDEATGSSCGDEQRDRFPKEALELGWIRPTGGNTKPALNLLKPKPQKGCNISLDYGLWDFVKGKLYKFALTLLESQTNRRLKSAGNEEP